MVGRGLIQAGADAVIGTSAHVVQGVEIYQGRPILYDIGNLLFDSHGNNEQSRSALFLLTLHPGGIRQIEVLPVDIGYGMTTRAEGNSAARTLLRFRDLSAELGTVVRIEEGRGHISLPVPAERESPRRPRATDPSPAPIRPTTTRVPEGCVAESVPPEHQIDPIAFGPITLLGLHIEASELKRRQTVWVETWWRTSAPLTDDLWLYQRIGHESGDRKWMWWGDHEPCDWQWPTSRWKTGTLYRDRYGIRPPADLPAAEYSLTLGLRNEEDPVGEDRVLESLRVLRGTR